MPHDGNVSFLSAFVCPDLVEDSVTELIELRKYNTVMHSVH